MLYKHSAHSNGYLMLPVLLTGESATYFIPVLGDIDSTDNLQITNCSALMFLFILEHLPLQRNTLNL